MPTHKSSEHEEDTDNDECLNSSQAIGFGYLGRNTVEDVDKNEEDGDKDGHPTRDAFRGYNEAGRKVGLLKRIIASPDPGDNHKHA